MLSGEYWENYYQWHDTMVEEDAPVVDAEDATTRIIETEHKRTGKGEYAEYVHMNLPSGESVKFKRGYGGYRFTDEEVRALMDGVEIRISTDNTEGIIGSLDWMTYKGYDYFGFAPWAPESYVHENAPMPKLWSGRPFTEEEKAVLRKGQRILIAAVSKNTGNSYGLHLSFDLLKDSEGKAVRWAIVPHFEEFEKDASEMTRADCLFLPSFGGRSLNQAQISLLRSGKSVYFPGVSKAGKHYDCWLRLGLDITQKRWRLYPEF